MKVLQAELPDKLYEQIKLLIDTGWFQDEKSVCSQHPDSVLLTDDASARLVTKTLGIRTHGTIGVLLRSTAYPLVKPLGNLKKFR